MTMKTLAYLVVGLMLIATLALQAQGNCPLTRAMVEGTNRIFTNRDAAGNYELKRVQTVRSGETLHMICRPTDIVQTTCRANGTFTRPLPLRCNNPMVATATAVTDTSCPAPSTMYSIGYTLNNRRLELYRACYDRPNVRAVFSVHRLYPKTFFPQRPCVDFTTDGVISNTDAASFQARNVFNTFKRIYGNNQRYIPNERTVVINRGHLTPSADFLFGDQMCATFKYVNVVPQFKSINERNWGTIERYVRTRITGGFLNIKTGIMGALGLPDAGRTVRRANLASGGKNPVPLWMYKVVRSATNQPMNVFLTYNNIFAATRPPAPTFCTSIPCPITLDNQAAAGYTYCCNATTFRV